MSEAQITIEVDGRTLPARKGQMLIEVTDAHDIYIPRFCYHQKLTVAANCRMCLVEVEKAPKALPACATPVMPDMKVRTRSAAALDAQKSIMEFLLINHPLDCPICDQGGECELQDLALGYGRDVSRYQEKKRVVKDKNIGPLIQTDLTRCIHCTRCVRFGEEIAGMRELGATGRGENMEIGAYIEKQVESELSGNVIDLCPVGALTSKPYRYSARAWELAQKDAIAPHDSVGSNIHLHVKGDRVKRVVPAANEAINEVWLSDRDRFSYEAIYSADRLSAPMLKTAGQWREVDWETALAAVRTRLGGLIEAHGAERLGALASPSATLEEAYLLQKLLRKLGCNNIDHRLRQADFSDQEAAPPFPWLGRDIADFESLEVALLVGSQLRKEQPIINHRLRKAALKGAAVMAVNPVDYDFNLPLAARHIAPPAALARELAGILNALAALLPGGGAGRAVIDGAPVSEAHRSTAKRLLDADQAIVLLGNRAAAQPQVALLRALAGEIARRAGARLGYLSEGANSSGCWLAGALPHRLPGGRQHPAPGLHARAMLEAGLRAFVLLGVEPELDCAAGRLALAALKGADSVIALSAYQSEAMREYAEVLLPLAVFAETAGTYINNAGTAQGFAAAARPPGEARPGWKILRVLGNTFGLDGFAQQSSADALSEALHEIGPIRPDNAQAARLPATLDAPLNGTQLVTETPMYMIDPLCRRARALQQTRDVADGALHINARLAEKNRLSEADEARVEQDDGAANLKVVIDERLPDDCALIQAPHPAVAGLGAAFGAIRISRHA